MPPNNPQQPSTSNTYQEQPTVSEVESRGDLRTRTHS